MITPSQIYWLAKLDDIRSFFIDGFLSGIILVLVVLGVVASVILTIVYLATYDEIDEGTSNVIKRTRNMSYGVLITGIILGIVTNLIAAFIPSTKQMAAIVVIPRIANSEAVSELGDLGKDLVGLAKEWVEEIRPKKKETK